jgi:hypothetical protein
MNMDEFNKTAVRTDDGRTITFDVRPFGDRQGEAIDSYLHARLMHTGTTGIGNTSKHVVLLCDSVADVPNSARNWLLHLNNAGQSAEVRQA